MLAPRFRPAARQRGVILVITLVALAAMTLAGVALMRSADTAGLIAGNLAFQQSVTLSADAGVEAAITWLEANNTGGALYASNAASGYAAAVQDPAGGQSWEAFWTAVLAAQSVALAEDVAGNTVSYAIQRLCYGDGVATAEGKAPLDPTAGCPTPPPIGSTSNNSQGAGLIAPAPNRGQVYYRITVRIGGPRDTVNYVQAIVAL